MGTSTSSSSQPQHSHLVIQQLLSHLDANSRSAATVRAGIVEVLSEAAVIAATGSVGKGALKGQRTALGGRLPRLSEKGKALEGSVRIGFPREEKSAGEGRGRGSPWLEVGLGLPGTAGEGRMSEGRQRWILRLPPLGAQGPRCWRCLTLC